MRAGWVEGGGRGAAAAGFEASSAGHSFAKCKSREMGREGSSKEEREQSAERSGRSTGEQKEGSIKGWAVTRAKGERLRR